MDVTTKKNVMANFWNCPKIFCAKVTRLLNTYVYYNLDNL